MSLERDAQKAIFKWFCLQYPHLKNFFIKIDNEGNRKVLVKNGRKVHIGLISAMAQGLNPSTPDMFIALPVAPYAGLWIELKPEGWKPRSTKERDHAEKQLARIELLRSVGYDGYFCVGALDAIDKIKTYLRNYRS